MSDGEVAAGPTRAARAGGGGGGGRGRAGAAGAVGGAAGASRGAREGRRLRTVQAAAMAAWAVVVGGNRGAGGGIGAMAARGWCEKRRRGQAAVDCVQRRRRRWLPAYLRLSIHPSVHPCLPHFPPSLPPYLPSCRACTAASQSGRCVVLSHLHGAAAVASAHRAGARRRLWR